MSLESQICNDALFSDLVTLNSKINHCLLFDEVASVHDLRNLVELLNRRVNDAFSTSGYKDYKPKYFTMQEFSNSFTASKYKIDNSFKDDSIIANNLRYLIANVLDPARQSLDAPIMVTSGYRCSELNKLVGGSSKSYHLKGRAADLVCHDNEFLYDILSFLPHTELIKHQTYIHVSL